jgi:hypothetical protein
MLYAVKTLLKKYKRAKKGVDDTKVPFKELTHSLEFSKVSSWEKDEKEAMEQCGEYLDIYQLKIDKGKHFGDSSRFHMLYILMLVIGSSYNGRNSAKISQNRIC